MVGKLTRVVDIPSQKDKSGQLADGRSQTNSFNRESSHFLHTWTPGHAPTCRRWRVKPLLHTGEGASERVGG